MDFKKSYNTNNGRVLNNNSSSGLSSILWIILYLVIAFIISYITVMTIKYLKTPCDRKSYFRYIFSFCYKDVCKTPDEPVKTEVHYMDVPSKDMPKGYPHDGKTDPAVDFDVSDLGEREQVFHISNQDYTYEQAKCKCKSYDAKLATYGQLVDAYNNGADWCSYGWSEGQSAFYPTQKCRWERLSKEERRKCGKPGINGGFFSDPYLKFGVNCYGKKPEGEVIKMKDKKCDKNYCKLPENSYANKRLATDQIAPFNEKEWSM